MTLTDWKTRAKDAKTLVVYSDCEQKLVRDQLDRDGVIFVLRHLAKKQGGA